MYKLLVFLILIYLFFRIFTRYLLPWVLKYYIERFMKKKFGNSWSPQNEMQADKNPDISFNLKKSKFGKTKYKKDEGEYIDFTELK